MHLARQKEARLSGSRSAFDASASALGYAMQFRYALYRALEALQGGLGWQISIEAADDVELNDHDGSQLLQIKNRAPGTALTNASTDLWKTLRIWSEGVKSGSIDISSTQLVLVTTAAAADGTAAAVLLPGVKRDIDAAHQMLQTTVDGSGNKDNAKAFDAWRALTTQQQKAMLSAVIVVSDSSDIHHVADDIRRQLVYAVRREHIDAFFESLEGWWFQRCVRLLGTTRPAFIDASEIDAYFNDLRERFLPGNLPIASDIDTLELDPDAFGDRPFVQQLGLARIGALRVADAVRDYLRAYAQRSRWTRQNLLLPDELTKYERRLVEEWRYLFNRLIDDLPPGTGEDEKIKVAREIYAWVEEASAPPIRSLCTERFLIRGSLHILADDLTVGWHPDFTARLMAVLEPASA